MSAAFNDRPHYMLMIDYGNLGWEGICLPEKTKAELIDDLATKQHDDRPFKVYELFEGSVTDITAEIERALPDPDEQAWDDGTIWRAA